MAGRTIYHTLHVFNVLSTFKHYFTQNMMFSSVNTYNNFHSNVKEIKKILVNVQVERVSINTTKDLLFSNSSHLEWRAGLSDTILKGTHPGTIPARFGLIWFSGFRRDDLNVKVYGVRRRDAK